jgi:hypothetical protein
VTFDLSEGDDEVSTDFELETGADTWLELLPVALLDDTDAGLELTESPTVTRGKLPDEPEPVCEAGDGSSTVFFDGVTAVAGNVSLPVDDDFTEVAELPVELGEAPILGVDSCVCWALDSEWSGDVWPLSTGLASPGNL